MNENIAQKLDIDGKIFWNVLSALALGTLLGTLAVMPYDHLFGLPSLVCDGLQSAIALAVLSGLGIGRKARFTLKAKNVSQTAHALPLPERERAKVALRGLVGNLNRLFSVLKVQWNGHPEPVEG